MAADFEAQTGIAVEVIPVTESDLGTRATAAFAAGDLPDVIYHTLQYALPWAEAGILDTEAATDVVEDLGAGTFASGALNMAAVDGGYASVPVDGWTQMIVYRKDLFDAAGLEPPTTYANLLAAVEALRGLAAGVGSEAPARAQLEALLRAAEQAFAQTMADRDHDAFASFLEARGDNACGPASCLDADVSSRNVDWDGATASPRATSSPCSALSPSAPSARLSAPPWPSV